MDISEGIISDYENEEQGEDSYEEKMNQTQGSLLIDKMHLFLEKLSETNKIW